VCGGRLVSEGQITFSAMFKAFFILVSTGRMIAEAGSMTSDLAKGASTVASVFGYMDRVSQIDPDDEDAEKLEKVEGHVEIRNVDFAYPMRPDILVFKGTNHASHLEKGALSSIH
jgi:ATP-binding cassette subfamily B (MDR/TAP) protein 1